MESALPTADAAGAVSLAAALDFDWDWTAGAAASNGSRKRVIRRIAIYKDSAAVLYSHLRAMSGSTRVARVAGSHAASMETASHRAAMETKVIGSAAVTDGDLS